MRLGYRHNDSFNLMLIEKVGNINILDLLSKLAIIISKGEARRLIEQGGIVINNDKKTNINEILDLNVNKKLIVKKGKKTFVKVIVK